MGWTKFCLSIFVVLVSTEIFLSPSMGQCPCPESSSVMHVIEVIWLDHDHIRVTVECDLTFGCQNQRIYINWLDINDNFIYGYAGTKSCSLNILPTIDCGVIISPCRSVPSNATQICVQQVAIPNTNPQCHQQNLPDDRPPPYSWS